MRSHDAADYTNQMNQLMPTGLAWSRVRGSANERLLEGMAEEPARIEARAIYLVLKEFFAQSARELLSEWEVEYGLPDECTTLGVTYEERIENLLRKIRTIGGQSIEYLIGVAAALGIEIAIGEFKPFRAGMSRAGDRLYSREWRFVFRVIIPSTRMYWFRAGRNSAGDPLRYWRRNEILECIINKLKPSHSFVIYAYVESFTFLKDGDAVLRNEILDVATDPILERSVDGSVSIQHGLESGAENETMHVDVFGNITVKD